MPKTRERKPDMDSRKPLFLAWDDIRFWQDRFGVPARTDTLRTAMSGETVLETEAAIAEAQAGRDPHADAVDPAIAREVLAGLGFHPAFADVVDPTEAYAALKAAAAPAPGR